MEFYIVKCGYSEDGEISLDKLERRDIETLEATDDYELATRRLLYSTRWNNIYDIIWLEVYKTESYNSEPYIYVYNMFGKTTVGEKICLSMGCEQFETDLSQLFCDIDEIEHYIPAGKENLYKQLVMENKLLKK